MVNFYTRFLPGIARTLQPLTDTLKGAPKTLEWPPAAAAAFGAAKAALEAAVPLAHPALNAVLSLATDASDTHVGGVLQQLNGGKWKPLAFYSKKFSYLAGMSPYIKGLVAVCHTFCLFFLFITYSTDIHSITFIQSTYPSPFAGAFLHLLIAL